ncbi:MAG: zinc ribbon domain-containing protein [Oscillibacter sp.]|jgi:rubrerythrin|nr:zinc ribbon domain-containing protein [Oscillibacter sp.]
MAFFDDLSRKAKDVASVATEKAKDAAELAKINMAIAGEQREMDKNYRTIGEWFVTEYSGEIPEAVKDLVDAVAASKSKIADLEASKPSREDAAETVPESSMKKCPICGAVSDSKFCPQCGAPMGE